MTDEERELAAAIEVGTLDQELRLMRIRLRRHLAQEHTAQGQPELTDITENDGAGERIARTSRRSVVRDYFSIIDKITARIASLEQGRMELLLAKKKLDDDDPGDDGPHGFEMVEYGEEISNSGEVKRDSSSN